MEAHIVNLLASKGWALRGSLSASPILPASETLHHEGVHLIELSVGIAQPKIIPPDVGRGAVFLSSTDVPGN